MNIHPTAMVDSTAKIAEDAKIGAYAVVGPEVEIGSGTVVDHHANIERLTKIGSGCRIWSYAMVGADPQDLKYKGERSFLTIGDNVKIREFATIHRGSADGGGITTVGNDCLLMAYSHVAHDCHVGNGVIMANSVNLGGHVTLEDRCALGGLVAVHQFVRIGTFCFVGGMSGVAQDLPPYTLAEGSRAKTRGLNSVGLKRAGYSQEAVDALKKAYRTVFLKKLTLKKALEQVRRDLPDLPEVRNFVRFIESSQRGIPR